MPAVIKKIIVGSLSTNCYVVSCEHTGNTFIIDPGDNPRPIINYIFRNEFIPKGIILTHGHPDHTGAVKIIKGELNAPLLINQKDVFMLAAAGIKQVDGYLTDREILPLGRLEFLVIHTPGHSPGSVCIHGKGILFSGDTLFRQGVGRTDLPGGSGQELEDSLKNKVLVLPGETIVYPGHGPETTIADERMLW